MAATEPLRDCRRLWDRADEVLGDEPGDEVAELADVVHGVLPRR
jgi:hypothetical protein